MDKYLIWMQEKAGYNLEKEEGVEEGEEGEVYK